MYPVIGELMNEIINNTGLWITATMVTERPLNPNLNLTNWTLLNLAFEHSFHGKANLISQVIL